MDNTPEAGAPSLPESMAYFVRDQVAVRLACSGIDWRIELETISGIELRMDLTRGNLRLPASVRRPEWWLPKSRRTADRLTEEIAPLLSKWHSLYSDAEPDGRRRRAAWTSTEGHLSWEERPGFSPVTLMLAPGVRISSVNGGAHPTLCRVGWDVSLLPDQAKREGWYEETA